MTGAQAAGLTGREADSAAASAVKAMQAEGRHAEARERYAELVGRHQRRAVAHRVPLHARCGRGRRSRAGRLRQGVLAPGVVPRGAPLRSLVHAHPDQRVPGPDQGAHPARTLDRTDAGRARAASGISRSGRPATGPSPEDQLLARERRERLARALAKLPERQRSVFMLSHYEGCTSREVSAMTGLNESTVRVHLFRAIRKLRALLARPDRCRTVPWRNAVSILNRLRLNSHLDDAAIAAIWTDSALDGTRRRIRISSVCTACRTRFAAVLGWLDDAARSMPRREADELFPAERLAAQHAQIFRRIEAAERPARVIAFPRFARPLTSPHVARIPLDCRGRSRRPHRRRRRRAGDGSPAHRRASSAPIQARLSAPAAAPLAIEPRRCGRRPTPATTKHSSPISTPRSPGRRFRSSARSTS